MARTLDATELREVTPFGEMLRQNVPAAEISTVIPTMLKIGRVSPPLSR